MYTEGEPEAQISGAGKWKWVNLFQVAQLKDLGELSVVGKVGDQFSQGSELGLQAVCLHLDEVTPFTKQQSERMSLTLKLQVKQVPVQFITHCAKLS